MNKIPLLLSSLALTAAASAQSTATSSSSTVITYSAPASVTVADVPGGTYDGRADGQYGAPDYDDAGGTTTLTYPGSTSFSYTGDTITIASNTAASLDSANYAAVGSTAGVDNLLGYRDFLQFTNASTAPQTLSFAIDLSQGEAIAAASPYGCADDLDGDYFADTTGAFAGSLQHGGLIDVTDPNDLLLANGNNGIETSSFNPSEISTVSANLGASVVLQPGETRTYEFYASTESFVQFNPAPAPAPEPAPLAALGVGAVALLRRRRRA